MHIQQIDRGRPVSDYQEGQEPSESPKPLIDLLTVSAISTILLFGFLLVKVYGVAHFNINVIAALISASQVQLCLELSQSTAIFSSP